MKWFNLLTNEELLNFWKTQDNNIENKIRRDYNGDIACVYFWEFGWGKTKKKAIATRYELSDFRVEFIDAIADESEEQEINTNYIEFMVNRFGKPYIADLLERKVGFVSEWWLKKIS